MQALTTMGRRLMAGIPEARFMNVCDDSVRPKEIRKMAIAGLNPAELIELALLLVLVGALAGFLAGIFGIGGGAVLVPVFY